MRDFFSREHWVTIRRCWPWLAIASAGFVAHVGTALLRLSTFFPSPKLLDFAGFYASAWAIRQGLSPYNLPPEWLQSLQTAQAVPLTPPVIFNPPFWPWLLQPLTWFSFPVAASIWLFLNLALLVWATTALADVAGYGRLARRSSWAIWVPLFFLVLTFGPVFLDLTLGQTSVVLLATALAIGRSLSCDQSGGTGGRPAKSAGPTAPFGPRDPARRAVPPRPAAAVGLNEDETASAGRRSSRATKVLREGSQPERGGSSRRRGPVSALVAALAGGLAVGVKLFPLTWLGALPFLRRWRELILMTLSVVAVFGLGFIVSPTSSREYGKYLLTERLATSSEVTSVDDQALIAWLDRLVRPQTFAVSGVGVEQRTTVVWSPPWAVDARVVRWVGYVLLVLLLLPCLFLLLRVVPAQHEAAFYLWVLYCLIALLHIERYNHVLLLPAMAWLWGRGRWQRIMVVVGYALVGLSRLTHLWAVLLPAPWGPLAAGFGMYAVFLLGVAIVVSLWPSTWATPPKRDGVPEREVE